MNLHGIRAIYRFEMARTFRTLTQSIASPVLSTSLYFVVFGAAIGSRMGDIDGVSYGAFIIPGLIMLSLLNESISNASFGINANGPAPSMSAVGAGLPLGIGAACRAAAQSISRLLYDDRGAVVLRDRDPLMRGVLVADAPVSFRMSVSSSACGDDFQN